MADCSKTEVFLAEWERMCDNTDCECCDAMSLVKRCGAISCNFAIMRNKEDAIEIIQKWSDSHPAPSTYDHRIKCWNEPYYRQEI